MSPAGADGPRHRCGCEVSDEDALADAEVEITATGGQYQSAGNGRGPDDLIFDQALDVVQHRVSLVAGLCERSVGVGAQDPAAYEVRGG